jgi:hypothetical protein
MRSDFLVLISSHDTEMSLYCALRRPYGEEEADGGRPAVSPIRLPDGRHVSLRARPRGLVGPADRSDEGRGRVGLVTGASAGIGRSYATLLAAKGFDVVAVARRADRLDTLCAELAGDWGVRAHRLIVDLQDPTATTQIVTELRERELEIDYLVNNAGYGLMGNFIETPWDHQRAFVQVMGLAPIELSRALMPGMVSRGWGRLVNVASLAAWVSGTPTMVLYGGTKSMLHSFTHGVAAEVASAGVHCTVVSPGFTDTEIFGQTGLGEPFAANNRLAKLALMSPDVVARQAYTACEQGKRAHVPGWHHKLIAAVAAHSPQPVRNRFADRLAASTLIVESNPTHTSNGTAP